jgi:4-amino-4-deoxy-L-arabinose transferase-like glycosyltransferase
MDNSDMIDHSTSVINEKSMWFKAFLVILFIIAALIRQDDIRAPGHLIEREYNSAVFARAFYFENNDLIEPWRQENARITKEKFPLLEPPVTEYFVSIVYRIVGQEEIWYGRYVTSAFWLIGGIFLYKLVRKLISVDAAVIAVAYFLFVPWGIIISRSVQPDALMMMMYIISLFSIVTHFEKPEWRRLLIAGLITGLTLLLRPLVIFAIFGAFIALAIHKKGNVKQIFDKQLSVFIILSLAFPLAFYGYGILIAGFLRGQAALSFRPHLLFQWKFWQNWFELGTEVVGHTALVASFLGFLFLRKSISRTLVIGLIVGYLSFGVFFTFHVITHPYYHIQLFPIVAVCASFFFVYIGTTLKNSLGKKWWAPVTIIFLFVLYFNVREVRSTLYTSVFENPSMAAEIGDLIHHSARTVYVAHHYGAPLEYYGEFSGLPWPVRIDDPFYRPPNEKERSVQERLAGLGFEPEFFVITNFDLFNRKHQDLQVYLEENCRVYAEKERYLIYNACQPTNYDR